MLLKSDGREGIVCTEHVEYVIEGFGGVSSLLELKGDCLLLPFKAALLLVRIITITIICSVVAVVGGLALRPVRRRALTHKGRFLQQNDVG